MRTRKPRRRHAQGSIAVALLSGSFDAGCAAPPVARSPARFCADHPFLQHFRADRLAFVRIRARAPVATGGTDDVRVSLIPETASGQSRSRVLRLHHPKLQTVSPPTRYPLGCQTTRVSRLVKTSCSLRFEDTLGNDASLLVPATHRLLALAEAVSSPPPSVAQRQ
jgi:hypothetical protein